MSHESNTSSLWSAAKERDLSPLGPKGIHVSRHGIPRLRAACSLEIIQRQDMSLRTGVNLDNSSVSNL
jgi:hypothetical protein